MLVLVIQLIKLLSIAVISELSMLYLKEYKHSDLHKNFLKKIKVEWQD